MASKVRWAALRASTLGMIGSFSSAFGAFAMLCCFGWTRLSSVMPVIGLGIFVHFSVALRLIWIALGLTVLGLAVSLLRHRRPWPLLLAAVGAGLVLYPMYHALEVPVWLGLLYSGLGLLFVSSALDAWSTWRTTRVCAAAPKDVRNKLRDTEEASNILLAP